ncbi:MAG: hypothetical protein U9O94_02240 [Nanoarchaeota archaeon]|nr:hypothetical protein [Nanoarchaeota archaeon]
MNDVLLLILSLVGLLALYWVFAGQWKWNKMLRETQEKEIEREIKKKDEKSNTIRHGRRPN